MTLHDLFTLLHLPIGTSGHDMTQLHYRYFPEYVDEIVIDANMDLMSLLLPLCWRYWRHSWYGLEAPVDVEEAHEVLESLMKTMMPWQRSWNPNGTLMKPLYVLWWWWPYMVSGMWWMPLPWKRSLEGSWTWYMKISGSVTSCCKRGIYKLCMDIAVGLANPLLQICD